LIRPSEWLPIIFDEQEAVYDTLEEAQQILGQIMTLYNSVNAAASAGTLPADCPVRPRPLDNLDESAPLALWSRGYMVGHDWLADLWDVELPPDLDEELGVVLMALSFFSSRKLAEAFLEECGFARRIARGAR